MRLGRALHAVTVAAVVGAGCAFPGAPIAPPPAASTWKDTDTPPSTVAPDREVRYYRDSSGGTWDDRGRRVEPGAAPPEGR